MGRSCPALSVPKNLMKNLSMAQNIQLATINFKTRISEKESNSV
jgi:hypothetical protein